MTRLKYMVLGIGLLLLVYITASGQSDALIYAERGQYSVGTQEFVIADDERPLSVTIWYPASNPENVPETTTYTARLLVQFEGQALRDAAPNLSGGPYPLVIFSHGSGGLRYQSLFFTEHLASYGFIVMAADHPGNTLFDQLPPRTFLQNIIDNYAYRPQDVLREIAFAESLASPGGALAGLIDLNTIVVSGHSFGGYTALAAAGARLNFDALDQWCEQQRGDAPLNPDESVYSVCFLQEHANEIAEIRELDPVPNGVWPVTTDPRIKAVIALAPWNGPIFGGAGLDELTVPALIMVGSGDVVTPPERDAHVIYAALTSRPKLLVTLQDAGHFVFVDECNEFAEQMGFSRLCSDSVWDMNAAHTYINYLSTAFLLSVLKGDDGAILALAPGSVMFEGITYQMEQ